jgi:tRNA 2-thiouridine synthesizing protein A
MNKDVTLDCYGVMCPMPIIKTKKQMEQMRVGQVLEVLATDEGIIKDMPAWCGMTGQEFLGAEREGDMIKVYVKKIKNT